MSRKKDQTLKQELLFHRQQIVEISSRLSITLGIGREALIDGSKVQFFLAHTARIDDLFQDYSKTHKEIYKIILQLESDTENYEEDQSKAIALENVYYEIKSIEIKLKRDDNKSFMDITPLEKPLNPHGLSPNYLPRIDLKTFNGTAADFPEFMDTFNSLVHRNNNISDLHKFHLLKNSLGPKALSAISSIPVLEANYGLAYDALYKRFFNKRLIAEEYISNLFNVKPINDPQSLPQIQNFIAHFCESVNGLSKVDIPNKYEFLLFVMASRNLEPSLRQRFEETCKGETFPTFASLNNFLEETAKTLEIVKEMRGSDSRASTKSRTKPASKSFLTSQEVPQNPGGTCNCCKVQGHRIYSCKKFLDMGNQERYDFARQYSLCFNCLSTGHHVEVCGSLRKCFHCKARHHSLLCSKGRKSPVIFKGGNNTKIHQSSPQSAPVNSSEAVSLKSSKDQISLSAGTSSSSSRTVLLGTVQVNLRASNGKWKRFRGILDSGSQLNFISSECRRALGLPETGSHNRVSALSGAKVLTEGEVSILLRNDQHPKSYKQLDATVIETITSPVPSQSIDFSRFKSVFGFKLADPYFYKRNKIDILLGSEIFARVLKSGRHSFGNNLPVLLETELGWIVQGSAPVLTVPKFSLYDTSDISLLSCCDANEELKRLWALEEVPNVTKPPHPAEDHYVRTHSRQHDGRYVLKLPFKSDPSKLGNSYNLSYKRFLALERKFVSQPEFAELYRDFMKEFISLGHLELLPATVNPTYIIPHHGVYKKSSNKLRVVFDASMPTTTGISLNNILDEGPKTQTNLTDILLRFRAFKYVFTADIRHMFRQILIDPSDRIFQCILWRETPSEEIKIYQLNTVVYGLASSPFQATRTLHQLAIDEGKEYPQASKLLTEQTFVDDILGGANTLADLRALICETHKLLNLGGFQLRKWTSNCPEVLETFPADHKETPIEISTANESIFRILGLKWSQTTDSFHFDFRLSPINVTKRTLLSQLNSIYDPLGFVNPVVFVGKCLLRDLWVLGVDWDDAAPNDIVNSWTGLINSISALNEIRIPRFLNIECSKSIELHAFSDASEKGYGACIYARTQTSSGFSTNLLMARSRIAPLKRVTIPRLELLAAHLASKLMLYVSSLLEEQGLNITRKSAWSDSMIALAWIKLPPHTLQTFVANRVVAIQETLAPDKWFHIPGAMNPADIISRGSDPSDLVQNVLWWSGPSFLQQPADFWPQQPDLPRSDIPEIKPHSTCLVSSLLEDCWFEKYCQSFSKLGKLVRVTAYLKRFKKVSNHLCLAPLSEVPPISVVEWNDALKTILKLVQKQAFHDELEKLHKNCLPSVPFRRLSVFVDSDGFLRVGGRLRHSSLTTKHPIILPKKHWVTSLLIDWYHQTNLHAGPHIVHALILEKYWILSARSIIRHQLYKCVTCFRSRPKPAAPPMGDLPAFRVTPSRPFSKLGCDFAGPFMIRSSTLRKAPLFKAYFCVFICLTTKAFHLEAVSGVSTSDYIAALSRFVARRGRPTDIFTDMGGGFVGGARLLKSLMQDELQRGRREIEVYSLPKGITFHFNPPYAPFCGGIWESAVKLTKTILLKTIGTQILTLEEFSTLLAQVEAVANSRPLTPLTAEPDNYDILTPGHFLIGEPLLSIPEPDLSHESPGLLKRWALVQQIHQHFWKRWQREYLHTLQQKTKWFSPDKDLKPGQLVLLKDENAPPLQWPRCRILRTFPGQDKITRVVEVTTPNGTLKRHVRKLCPLPIDEDSS